MEDFNIERFRLTPQQSKDMDDYLINHPEIAKKQEEDEIRQINHDEAIGELEDEIFIRSVGKPFGIVFCTMMVVMDPFEFMALWYSIIYMGE